MKQLVTLLLLFTVFLAHSQTTNPKYNNALADSLGADEYGMKQYVLVILKTGPVKIEEQAKRNALFQGHMENIGRLANEGKLVVAGPFGQNDKNYRGIFILNVKTVAEAQLLLETDPAVKEKLLEAEIFEWYGSAALGQYLEIHETIEKQKP